jgi:hypothetical protein
MWRALIITFAVMAQCLPENVYFGVGTTFAGADFTVSSWGNVMQVTFDAHCSASYVLSNQAARLQYDAPKRCTPACFAGVMRVETENGVTTFTPNRRGCTQEAARVRTARFVNQSTVRYIRDTDVMYFETSSV